MQLTIPQPDDWHLHLRDNAMLTRTVPDSSRYFSRAVIMPNLTPPVTNITLAEAYRQRIITHIPPDRQFTPLMTLYLTDNTSCQQVRDAKSSGIVIGFKLYPAGATTNSDAGVTDIRHCDKALSTMAELGLPLLIHGEVTDAAIDIFDREQVFIDTILIPLITRHPQLKIVLEHITTAQAVQFVTESHHPIAATITPHHLLLNRNDLLVGGIRPHHYCLPVLKRARHQQALITAATSGNPKFFLGTDSAPHSIGAKHSACGCAGIYSAHAAIELYAEVFEQHQALDKLAGFASHFGPAFYQLPRNKETITLVKQPWQVPQQLEFGNEIVIPFRAGEMIAWQIVASSL